ncbi:unnamed protein product (macronuclear) [Paramecium tetraurelia]|uniref:Uncharacterized protein n=1 Tax=Paramecium tetraurelia TaxID=5888 RepID=A0BLB0_PARTE|nr:uncharacterized protein GSPATT00029959001 [Paramecium tetraurelia]CAK59327.1 unnamed protein product [Paramecium tetraurelia]|eukprot:XP_001426725.1 hypothetical protein (macronuclear) [Paramecium tetraurelia strain d4-2]
MNNFKDQTLCNKHKREGYNLGSRQSQLQNQVQCQICQEEKFQTKNIPNYQILQQQSKQIKTQGTRINQDKKPFSYILEPKFSKRQEENCYAIEINEDMTFMIVGCNNRIKIYQFNQGNLKEIQVLEGHTDNVTTLSFMNTSNDIISGSDDKQIIIWQHVKEQIWNISQRIIGHSGQINCVIRNNNDDLIVSCSWDKTIKFWVKQNQWECWQTISEHTGSVFQLSFNQNQNRLISCGIDQFILVMELQSQDNKWIVIKKIWTSLQGNRLCFLSDKLFAFQPDNKEITQIYEINNSKKQYEKKNEMTIQGKL